MSRTSSFMGFTEADEKALHLGRVLMILLPTANIIFTLSSTFYTIFVAEALGGGDYIAGLSTLGILVAIMMITQTILDYPSGLQAMVSVNHYNVHADPFATFHFLGTGGAIDGTIGLMYDYPNGRPDTLFYSYKGSEPIEVELDEKWIPDAFVGPMASLMEAIETDGVPFSSTRDNLDTLRVVNAAYLSANENRSVRPEEIN